MCVCLKSINFRSEMHMTAPVLRQRSDENPALADFLKNTQEFESN